MTNRLILSILLSLPIFIFSQSDTTEKENFDIGKIEKINHFFDSLNLKYKASYIDREIKRIQKQNKFNGVVFVAHNNHVFYHNAHGFSNYKTKQKLDTNSIFELASVSKQFTAIAILKLYEEGKLDLKDSVQKFIPCFPYKKRTVHHLLCHRTGLPDYFKFSFGVWPNKDSLMRNDDLMDILCKKKYRAQFWVNTQHKYSNTGYVVLASIVEAVSGQKFNEYLDENFFKPLKMNSTFAGEAPENLKKRLTNGHAKWYGLREKSFMDGCLGDKGVWSTTHDLNIWSNAVFGGQIISDTLLHLATTPKNPDMIAEYNYGYGYRLGKIYDNQNLVFHGGLWGGFNTLFIRRLQDNISIIVLSNLDNKSFSKQSGKWIEIIEQL